MTYHVNNVGKKGVCRAKSPADCPFEQHFNTEQEADTYAEMNAELFAHADLEPSTDQALKGDDIPNQGYKSLANLLDKSYKRLADFKKRTNREYKMDSQGLTKQQFFNNKMKSSQYKRMIKFHKLVLNQAKTIEGEREYFEELRNEIGEDVITHVSYSSKSSSAYLYIDSSNYNRVMNILESRGLKMRKRPDLEKYLGDTFTIRLANHTPPEYNGSDYWYVPDRPSLLIDYPKDLSQNTNKKEHLVDSLRRKANRIKKHGMDSILDELDKEENLW